MRPARLTQGGEGNTYGPHHLAANLVFDAAKDAYVVTVRRDGHELATHLDRADADDCMNGVKCVSLGIQVEQFVKNFELREEAGRKP